MGRQAGAPPTMRRNRYVVYRPRYGRVLTCVQGSGFTYRTGFADDCRNLFANKGVLDNNQDTNFRVITQDFPVFSFAFDLGSIKATSQPKVFAAGFVRDPAIKYTDLSGTSSQRSLFYNKKYTDIDSLVSGPRAVHQQLNSTSPNRSTLS